MSSEHSVVRNLIAAISRRMSFTQPNETSTITPDKESTYYVNGRGVAMAMHGIRSLKDNSVEVEQLYLQISKQVYLNYSCCTFIFIIFFNFNFITYQISMCNGRISGFEMCTAIRGLRSVTGRRSRNIPIASLNVRSSLGSTVTVGDRMRKSGFDAIRDIETLFVAPESQLATEHGNEALRDVRGRNGTCVVGAGLSALLTSLLRLLKSPDREPMSAEDVCNSLYGLQVVKLTCSLINHS